MKLVKALVAIGLIIFLIVFFIHVVNEYIAVKKTEKTISDLPKIEKELKQIAKEKENQIKSASEAEENKENQE